MCVAPLVAYSTFPPEAALARAAACGGCAAIALIWAVGSNPFHLWRDVLPSLLERLDEPVGAKAAKELQNRLKATTTHVLLLSVAMIPILAAVGYESIQAHPDSLYLWAAVAVFWVVSLPLLPSFLLGPFITSVAFVLAEGQVEELAAQARQTTAATADFDVLTDGVYRAHRATTELSRLLEPHVLCNTAWLSVVVVLMVVYGVAPRPAYSDCRWPECDWMNDVWGAGSWCAPTGLQILNPERELHRETLCVQV